MMRVGFFFSISGLDDQVSAVHLLHDGVHIGHLAHSQLFGEAVEVQAGAAGQDLHTLGFHALQVFQGHAVLAGDGGTAVVEQDGGRQLLLLAQAGDD